MECSCCGEEREDAAVATLLCRDDIGICRSCVGSLMLRAGGVDVTPTLPVADLDAAGAFYEHAGFEVRRYDDRFAFVSLDDQSVFDLAVVPTTDPATNGAGCYIICGDAERWHDRLGGAGLSVTAIEDQPWNIREFSVTDPSGNCIRIGRPIPENLTSPGREE